MKYHPVIEMLGVHRFKMGDFTDAFLKEIRLFAKKNDFESGPYLQDDAKLKKQSSSDDAIGSQKSDDIAHEPLSNLNSKRTAKVASSEANVA
jgi:hypothetical protein